ncbi:hypothetical protein like AT1G55360 [Hibiscus trionum]|uniref:Neprosin PEP catalytic domain-containing protein n=1 Tax=Hibiscus trionum TaxID=183268 RepID=A0A9W7LYY0_HIBTR|nr:hypothetical protein like AT1G55360 [Hibiscus trionum]
MGTWNHKKTKLRHCTFIFIAICHMFSYDHVDGRSISSNGTIEHTITGAIKTIQGEDGDIIHCVDIYKQPAFKHPLLTNHTIQMKPSSYPRGMEAETVEPELLQDWHKNGECPEGTIPIVRSPQHRPRRKTPPLTSSNQPDVYGDKTHEYAQVSLLDSNYFGASARLNVWKPETHIGEFSLAQILILANHGHELNTVEAGWQVFGGRDYTRLFIAWTRDGYQGTGCYNLQCPGFVQISKKIGLGGKLEPVSTYAGDQFEISIYIYKDKKSGNWWLRIQEIDVGYWPGSIFTKFSDRGEQIIWGGEIVNSGAQGGHTSTQMGSGHFPSEGYQKASYFRNIRYVDESGAIHDAGPYNVAPLVTKPECYDLQMGNKKDFGTHFFYGGPGYSDKCL